MSNPSIFPVDGFTPSGFPVAAMESVKEPQELFGYVQISTRDGDSLNVVGPGGFAASPGARKQRSGAPRRAIGMTDTVFISPGGWKTWALKWTPSLELGFVDAETIWQALDLGLGPKSAADGGPIAVAKTQSDGFWLAGAVRRLSSDQEQALRQIEAESAGTNPMAFRVRYAPSIRNQVFDGVLLLVGLDGKIRGQTMIDDYPFGFADSSHVFTFREAESGEIRIRMWRLERKCG
jgi:hypothetical protein